MLRALMCKISDDKSSYDWFTFRKKNTNKMHMLYSKVEVFCV